MPKEWTGNLVGLMHDAKVTGKQLASHMGITDRYVSMVLNGKRNPRGAEQRFRQALAEISAERRVEQKGGQARAKAI